MIGMCAGVIVSACACILGLAGHASPASAKDMLGSIPTVLHIDPVAPVVAGQSFTVTGIFYRHVEGGNAGIPHRGIKLYIAPLVTQSGGVTQTLLLATVFSDKDGRLQRVVHTQLESGQYRLYFLYQGSPTFRDAAATTELQVLAAPAASAPATKSSPPARSKAAPVKLSVTAPQEPLKPGSVATVTARLVDAAGTPIPDVNLYLRVSGASQQRRTNAQGWVTFVIKKPLDAGQHTLIVNFTGKNGYAPALKEAVITAALPVSTALTFPKAGATPYYVGDDIKYVAQLTAGGHPVPDQFLRFFVNGVFHHGAKTNADGLAELKFPRELSAGTHVVSATFRSTPGFNGTFAVLPVELLPRVLELRTVPPLQGVGIRVGEALLATDMQGTARMPITKSGSMLATVLPYQATEAGMIVEFDRWSDGVISTTRKLRLSEGITTTYQMGFVVSHPIILQFVEDASGRDVEAGRMKSIMLVNSAGEAFNVSAAGVNATGSGRLWLKANRIIRLDHALVVSPISYQLRNVTVDGVNVVNAGQQRFKVAPNERWTMKLQMHDLEVEVRDALLGMPLGKGLRVAYPTGEFRDVTLDERGWMRLESLSRGNYTVTVQGVMGIRSPMPIVLSRNREVDIAIISYLDMGIFGGMMVLFALTALIVGRRKTLPRLRLLTQR